MKCGFTDAQCLCCSGDIAVRYFKRMDDGSPFNFVKRKNKGSIRRTACSGLRTLLYQMQTEALWLQ